MCSRDAAAAISHSSGGISLRMQPFGRQSVMVYALLIAAGLTSAAFVHRIRDMSREIAQTGPQDDRAAGVTAPGFVDVATQSGLNFQMSFLPNEQGADFKINLYDHGSGVAVADYDGDGFEDVLFLNQLGANALYRNRGDGTFVETTKLAGVALEDRICVAASFADYDNDGDQDLFVTSTRGGNVLFRNEGDGSFLDVTKAAGVEFVGHSQSPLFFDFDGDGWLDLFVANTAGWTTDEFDARTKHFVGKPDMSLSVLSERESNLLYRNKGDGTFFECGKAQGIEGLGWSNDACLIDFDEDGKQDLLITNMFGPSQLYRRIGPEGFTNVTKDVLGKTPFGGMGAKAFDYDNDGHLDIFLVDMHSDMWVGVDFEHNTESFAKQSEKKKLGAELWANVADLPPDDPWRQEKIREFAESRRINLDEVVFGNVLFRNLGGGKFEEVSDLAGMETFWPWGVAAGDFDNDGFEDAFIASGMGFPFYYWPNQLMMNQGNGRFVDRANSEGIEPPVAGIEFGEAMKGVRSVRSSRCAAVADFNGDGRLDLVTNNFNHGPYYFRNQFPQQAYLALELKGTRSNRDAIGAIVHLYAGEQVMTRQVTSGGGYISQSSKRIHFGLGKRTAVDRVEILWPSGLRSQLAAPELNRMHPVREPAPEE